MKNINAPGGIKKDRIFKKRFYCIILYEKQYNGKRDY